MRLIDADVLKKYIKDGFALKENFFQTTEDYQFAKNIFNEFLDDIDEQPTANQWVLVDEKENPDTDVR